MLSDLQRAPIALESFDTIVEPDALVDALATRILNCSNAQLRGKCNGLGLVLPAWSTSARAECHRAPAGVEGRGCATPLQPPACVYVENALIAAPSRRWLERAATRRRATVYVTVGDGVGTGDGESCAVTTIPPAIRARDDRPPVALPGAARGA